MLIFWSSEILCILDLRSNSMLCSMLSIIAAAGYLVNCDFNAWGVDMTYLLLDYLIQFKTYWKVLLVLDGLVLERPRWRSKCGVLLLLIWEKEVLKVECPFGYPVSGSLSKSSQAGKLLNICLDSWLNVVFLDSSLGSFVANWTCMIALIEHFTCLHVMFCMLRSSLSYHRAIVKPDFGPIFPCSSTSRLISDLRLPPYLTFSL
ncbi:unnamed protein product [Sphenostylis stenocarpa]|uniref:Uncharacterized protein n=1 Tax=Sphenostylis stenocarpa TaxID=92480 RepID=A0AA86S798_9FABA|nr:unnamed protein product [Sphenostylis stenocarpa]